MVILETSYLNLNEEFFEKVINFFFGEFYYNHGVTCCNGYLTEIFRT